MSRVYFTDRDPGKQFPAVLAAAGLTVERHHDLFPPDATDEQWLAHCGTRSRVAITHDQRIRYKPNELAAVVRHRVTLLVVVGDAPYPELAKHFVSTLPKIEEFFDTQTPPVIAKVYRPSPIELARNPAASGNVVLRYPQ